MCLFIQLLEVYIAYLHAGYTAYPHQFLCTALIQLELVMVIKLFVSLVQCHHFTMLQGIYAKIPKMFTGWIVLV